MASNLLTTIRKPISSNKRLIGLVTIALLIIGLLGASYWYYIDSNEQNFKEYKLQTLDSYFDIISKRFTNDIQTYNSKKKENGTNHNQAQKSTSEKTVDGNDKKDSLNKIVRPRIWKVLTSIDDLLPNDNEFDDYIIRFKTKNSSEPTDTTRYLSSLRGSFHTELDSLLKSNKLNIGVSTAIPQDRPRYQLFAREYEFKDSIDSEINHIQIAITGLVSADRYKKNTRKLNTWIIALLVTFLLLCLFGLPFFKMVFIAEDERLNSKDVIMAGAAILVGAPVMVAIFLSLINYFDSYYNTIPIRLEHFSQQITAEFTTENRKAIQRLDQLKMGEYDRKACDSLICKEKGDYITFKSKVSDSLRQNFSHVTEEGDSLSCVCADKFIPLNPKNSDSLKFNFKFISKIDKKASVLYTINAVESPNDADAPATLKERIYFKDFKDSINIWHAKNGKYGKINYVMRPVVSIEDQKEEAVYILHDRENPNYLKVASAQLRSVHNPVVPFGYQYAVIDHKGEVWFHSKIGRSTLENFFDVSSQFGDLKAAVNGRVVAQGAMRYRDESQIFNVMPIEGTNLSVITLYDLGLLRIQVSEVLTITGIGIFLVLLLIGFISLFSVLRKNAKLGLYKFHVFPFEFLTPKAENEKSYILLTTLFWAVLVVAVPLSIFVSFLPSSSFILSFLFISWSYLLVYYSLKPRGKGNKLNLRITDTLLLLLIFGLDILLLRLGNQVVWIMLVVLPIQLICTIYLFKLQKIQANKTSRKWVRFVKNKIKLPYPKNYILFLFSWLLLASVFPTTLFFKKAKEINDLIWIKTDQFHMSKAYLQKEARIQEKLVPAGERKDFDGVYDYHLSGGQYLDVVSRSISPMDTLKIKQNYESDNFRKILWSTRPIYDEKIRDFQALIFRQSLDRTWKSFELEDDISFQMDYPTDPARPLTSSSNNIIEGHKKRVSGFIFIIRTFGLLGILALLYGLITFFIDRFIGFRFMNLHPNDFDTNRNKKYIPKFAKVLGNRDANSGLMLTGLPFSGKTAFAKSVLKAADCKNPAVLSLLKLDDLQEDSDIFEIVRKLRTNHPVNILSDKKVELEQSNMDTRQDSTISIEAELRKECAFIIENLEHHLMSFKANRIKLRLISFLITLEKPVILCSEVYPSQILGFYQNTKTASEEMNAELLSDFNAWRNILSAFPQVLIGITDRKENVKETMDTKEHGAIKKLVADELGYGKFLPTLAPVIYAKSLNDITETQNRGPRLDEQRMVMHTQNLSHGYYTDIWNSLPTRERYMLYDLAKDGFLNIKNGNSLFSLMKKGLIVWNDRPAIFNRSFKNFISSCVSMNEALRLEYKNRGEGSWGTVRIIFYLIILTIIVFIILGEPGVLKDFEALIGTLGGIGVIIPVLSSVLARGGQKS